MRAIKLNPNYAIARDIYAFYLSMLGRADQAYDTLGEQGYLRKYIELIRENESLPEAEKMFFSEDIAGYYARLGENEKALAAIEKRFDTPGVRNQLKFEPRYDTLHNEPRFKALVKRAGLEQ